MSNTAHLDDQPENAASTDAARLRLVPNAEGWQEVEVNDETIHIPTSWKATPLGKAFLITGGGTPSTKNPSYWGGHLVWTGPKYMGNDRRYVDVSHPDNRKLTKEGAAQVADAPTPAGSLIVSCRAPVGYANLAPCDLYTNQGCYSLIDNGTFSCEYAYFWVRKNKSILDANASGTTFMEISRKKLAAIEVASPPHPEQIHIATVLSAQETHINDLKALSKVERDRLSWLIEELLSGRVRVVPRDGGAPVIVETDSNGSAVEALEAFDLAPNAEGWVNIDVNGDTSPLPKSWSVEKLKDLALIVAGQSPDGTLVSKGQPDDEFVDFHQGNADFGALLTQPSGKRINRKQAPRLAKANSLLLSVRAPVGAINYAANELCFGRGLCAITAKTNAFIDYLRLQIVKQSPHLHRMADGSTFVAVTNHQVSNLELPTPPHPEQIHIATVLSAQERQVADIDALIKLEEQRLAWLTDELLSGRIRVVEDQGNHP